MPNAKLSYQRLKCLVLRQFNPRTTTEEKSSESNGLRRKDDERREAFKDRGPAMLENKKLLDATHISNVDSSSILFTTVEFYEGLTECASVRACLYYR